MSILPYVKYRDTTDASSQLKADYAQGVSSRPLLTALGDFWADHFQEIDTLAALTTGVTFLSSEVYSRLLDLVLSSSILHIPVARPSTFRLAVFSEQDFTETAEYFSVPAPDIQGIQFFVSSLFEPEVLMERGVHFDVTDGELRFYVDIFNDPNIFQSSYVLGLGQNRKILLWATDIAFHEEFIYERFGHYLYSRDVDAEGYKSVVTALLYFYVNTKSIKRIEAIINILFGLPFSRVPGETVTGIETEGETTTITTDQGVYTAPAFTEILVSPDQQLTNYELIARLHYVDDYLSDPDWCEGAWFPWQLVSDGIQIFYLNGTVLLNGVGKLDGTVFGNPLLDVMMDLQASATGTEDQQTLFAILSAVLKYNIVYIRTHLTEDSYAFWRTKDIDIAKMIQPGLPVYLYPLVETVFKVIFGDDPEELYGTITEELNITVI